MGDCIAVEGGFAGLPYEPFGDGFVVPCTTAHHYEVVFIGSFDEAAGAPRPEDIDTRIREACAAGFFDYLGAHLSESGLGTVLYLPDEAEWGDGLRYQACVAYDPGGTDPPASVSAGFRGAEHPLDRRPGACFTGRDPRTDPVPCTRAHIGELIGVFTHPAGAGAAFPGAAESVAMADAGCSDLLDGYAASGARGDADLRAGFVSLTRFEWEAGLRGVTCVAFATVGFGGDALLLGSLAEPGWRVLTGDTTA